MLEPKHGAAAVQYLSSPVFIAKANVGQQVRLLCSDAMCQAAG